MLNILITGATGNVGIEVLKSLDWQHAEAFEKAEQSQRHATHSEGSRFSGEYNDGNFSDFFSSMFGGAEGKSSQIKFRARDYNAELRLSIADAYVTHHQTITVNGKNIRLPYRQVSETGR